MVVVVDEIEAVLSLTEAEVAIETLRLGMVEPVLLDDCCLVVVTTTMLEDFCLVVVVVVAVVVDVTLPSRQRHASESCTFDLMVRKDMVLRKEPMAHHLQKNVASLNSDLTLAMSVALQVALWFFG